MIIDYWKMITDNLELNYFRKSRFLTWKTEVQLIPDSWSLMIDSWYVTLDHCLHENWDQIYWDQIYWDQIYWDQIYWDQIYWDQRQDLPRQDLLRPDLLRSETRLTETRFTEIWFTETRFTETRFTETRFTETRFTETRGKIDWDLSQDWLRPETIYKRYERCTRETRLDQ